MNETIRDNVCELVGHTPILRLNRLREEGGAELLAKLEMFNPGGSIKDRISLAMIEAAEQQGRLRPGGTIVEPTSGNTGIGLAMAAAARGYHVILTMPEDMSAERQCLLRAYGAEIILTPRDRVMQGAIDRAEELVREHPDYFMPHQFRNPANPEAHRKTTATEILAVVEGDLDALVAGVGTGGTITGTAEALRERIPSLRAYAVEPVDSPVLSGGPAAPHRIQGIGAGFVPEILNMAVVDAVVQVSYDDARRTTRALAAREGILAGVSSGAILYAAIGVAREIGESGRVLAILPDGGERYLSTELFQ